MKYFKYRKKIATGNGYLAEVLEIAYDNEYNISKVLIKIPSGIETITGQEFIKMQKNQTSNMVFKMPKYWLIHVSTRSMLQTIFEYFKKHYKVEWDYNNLAHPLPAYYGYLGGDKPRVVFNPEDKKIKNKFTIIQRFPS